MKTISRTSRFRRDYKRMVRQGRDVEQLKKIVEFLCRSRALPTKNKVHQLSGRWKRHRECHIEADWLLIYLDCSDEIILERTGSHSDLFE